MISASQCHWQCSGCELAPCHAHFFRKAWVYKLYTHALIACFSYGHPAKSDAWPTKSKISYLAISSQKPLPPPPPSPRFTTNWGSSCKARLPLDTIYMQVLTFRVLTATTTSFFEFAFQVPRYILPNSPALYNIHNLLHLHGQIHLMPPVKTSHTIVLKFN